MSLGLHSIAPSKGAKKDRKRVGRGLGSTGTYSGRGGKGQTARSGVSGLKRLGMKRVILSQPKVRGFKSLDEKMISLNIGQVARLVDGKVPVTIAVLKSVGAIPATARRVKILGGGEVTTALTIKQCTVSASARAKIEAAGGKVEA